MLRTALQPGGSGQSNSCNALPHCLGAVGSGTHVMQCHTAWGQWAVWWCIVLCCIMLCCVVLCCVVLCCVVLYCVVLCCVVLRKSNDQARRSPTIKISSGPAALGGCIYGVCVQLLTRCLSNEVFADAVAKPQEFVVAARASTLHSVSYVKLCLAVLCCAVLCCAVVCGVVCGVVWCGVVWCGVGWGGVGWGGVGWGGAWRGVAWRGVAWRGVAWRGVVWCGVVWCCAVMWCVVSCCLCCHSGVC